MLGKLENGVLKYAPKTITDGGLVIVNPSEEKLKELGYLPIITTDAPQTDEEHYPASYYKEENGQIVQKWMQIKDYSEMDIRDLFKNMFANEIQSMKVDDETALRMKSYYPTWEEVLNKQLEQGTMLTYKGTLYKTRQIVTPIQGQEPSIYTAALYEVIPEKYAGTLEEPILYKPPMELKRDLYYTDGVQMYICYNPTGMAVTQELKELEAFVRLV